MKTPKPGWTRVPYTKLAIGCAIFFSIEMILSLMGASDIFAFRAGMLQTIVLWGGYWFIERQYIREEKYQAYLEAKWVREAKEQAQRDYLDLK